MILVASNYLYDTVSESLALTRGNCDTAEWQEYPVRAEYLAELLLVNVQRVYLVVIDDRTKSRT